MINAWGRNWLNQPCCGYQPEYVQKAGLVDCNHAIICKNTQIRLAPRGNLSHSFGDPQGRHLRLAEVADEDTEPFDFDGLSDDEFQLAS